MRVDLARSVALVTGGGSGIGKAIAKVLAVNGAIVAVNDVSATGKVTADEILESGGKAALADRYRELFDGRIAANTNGNKAIIALLDAGPAMSGFGKLYVENNTKLELGQLLPMYGLALDTSGKKSQLQVSRYLSAEQKQLLRSLGLSD